MITKISIENYKSITKLDFSLGRFNILIGENGGGKSNLLEAISYGVAAALDKLDNEFLGLRGIRVTDPQFMVAAFEVTNKENIKISFSTDHEDNITCDIEPGSKNSSLMAGSIEDISEKSDKKKVLYLGFPLSKSILSTDIKNYIESLLLKSGVDADNIDIKVGLIGEDSNYSKVLNAIKTFVFYCPEESALRTFSDNYQLLPIGRKGEGLFKYLKELSLTEKGRFVLQEINENLCLLDWFDHIEVPEMGLSNDFTVRIKDRYVADTLSFFDQRSTNEGFLYLLFYFTLFISKDTPSFFAIDNIESSFNPKLCTKVVEVLQKLAIQHNKQVILTTHNPFVLDGLDLSDEDQRLFVVRRDDEGHTKVRRIEYKPERKKKLSELWMSGVIGGLPDNF